MAKNVREIPQLKGRIDIIAKEGKFVIERAMEDDAGNYSCSIGNEESLTFNVYGLFISLVPVKFHLKSFSHSCRRC